METADTVQHALRLWLRISAANRFEEATRDPARAQERKLLQIVGRNRDTVFGQRHGFGQVRSVRDFQERVQPGDYDALSPYVERSLRGEPNVLTAERPLMYATT
ncbi:MAG TPA: GH3 auxin-responsive promoter family protein, partial [Chloroflexota bacterium]|nr:GH3 auxin-responsive promoter family protein [Chloroflexota bacterium]